MIDIEFIKKVSWKLEYNYKYPYIHPCLLKSFFILNFNLILHDPTAIILLKKIGIWGISQIPRHLGNSRNFPNSYRNLMVVYFLDFGNFSNYWIFGKYPKPLSIWENSQIARYLRYFLKLKDGTPSDSLRNLGNSPDSQAFGEFPILTIF